MSIIKLIGFINADLRYKFSTYRAKFCETNNINWYGRKMNFGKKEFISEFDPTSLPYNYQTS